MAAALLKSVVGALVFIVASAACADDRLWIKCITGQGSVHETQYIMGPHFVAVKSALPPKTRDEVVDELDREAYQDDQDERREAHPDR